VRRADNAWAGDARRVTNGSYTPVDTAPLLRSRGDDRPSGVVRSDRGVALGDRLDRAVVLPSAGTAGRERLLRGARRDGLEGAIILPGAGTARSVGGRRGGWFARAVERATLVDAHGAGAQDSGPLDGGAHGLGGEDEERGEGEGFEHFQDSWRGR